MNNLVTTLFLIATLCLLPSWLAGCMALGAAIGIWIVDRRAAARSRERDAPPAPLPENVVRLKGRRWS